MNNLMIKKNSQFHEELTKEKIIQYKNNESKIKKLISDNFDNVGNLIFILENLGTIPKDFNISIILPLLKHSNEKVRFWAVKTVGKINSKIYLDCLFEIARQDASTSVKREAVSSIGRRKIKEIIPMLQSILSDPDPKIVCQAIRGLLTFKGNERIDNMLKEFIHHENEMIREIIYKEYFTKYNSDVQKLPHTKTYSYLKNTVVCGDVCDVLKMIPDESFHLTFTSPPYYNARDYSIYPSYEKYLHFLEKVFLEVFRTTKEGRFLVVNTSPVIIPRISRSHSSKRYAIPFDLHYFLVKMGWEFIDDIVWEKPEYSVKNRIGGFQQHRKPLAYKPNSTTEYLMVYRKHTDKLIDWNIRQYDMQIVNESKVEDGFESTNIWKISPKSDKVHSAVFPAELCQRVIKYYSFKNDLIFDPFAGSGTVGRVAKMMDRDFFLTEKKEKYFEYMKSLQSKDALYEDNRTKFLTLNEFEEIVL